MLTSDNNFNIETNTYSPKEPSETITPNEVEEGPKKTSEESSTKGDTVRSTKMKGGVWLFCISDIQKHPSESTETD